MLVEFFVDCSRDFIGGEEGGSAADGHFCALMWDGAGYEGGIPIVERCGWWICCSVEFVTDSCDAGVMELARDGIVYGRRGDSADVGGALPEAGGVRGMAGGTRGRRWGDGGD